MTRGNLAIGLCVVVAVSSFVAWLVVGREPRPMDPIPVAVDLSIPDPALDDPAVLRELPPPVTPRTDPATGFVVGGSNTTELIRKLTAINGRTIAELEADMRPGAESDVGSTKGFLGQHEKLLDVLAADNETVVTKLGLTHQIIGRELNAVSAIVKSVADYRHRHPVEFTFRGRRFRGVMSFYMGDQLSPFKDGTETNNDLDLENLDTGKKLRFSLLVPQMIERYGFYEGHGTPYRVDPEKVVEVLDFLKSAGK